LKARLLIVFLCLTLVSTAFSGCAGNSDSGQVDEKTHSIVDMAGRTVQVPEKVDKIFSTGPVGTILIYTLAPEKLAGWNTPLTEAEKRYILDTYRDLPVLGRWFGKNSSGNPEELLKVHPDVILSMGTVDETAVSSAERLQEQVGIPVLLVDGSIDKLDVAYRFVGKLLGTEERAEELASYCSQTITEVREKVAKIPPGERRRVYYAQGPRGLETDPRGSFHTEVLEIVGGINVAETPVKGGYGRASVSLEQVLAWDPDYIIVNSDYAQEQGGYNTNFIDSRWHNIKAVKDGNVYRIPQYPYNWFDRPPSVNRIIGIKWLANILYPDIFDIDIKAETKDFYAKFYHYDLSEKELNELLSTKVNISN